MSDQHRSSLWLSKDAIDGIRDLIRNRKNLEAIYGACSSQRPASSVMVLANRVANATQMETSSVYDVLMALRNLRWLHMASNLSSSDFVSAVSAAFLRHAGNGAEQETRNGWQETAPTLAVILPEIDRGHQLFISQKASVIGTPENAEGQRDSQRQQEIEDLRARDEEGFDRVESIMPDLHDLISISTPPPREWLDEPLP